MKCENCGGGRAKPVSKGLAGLLTAGMLLLPFAAVADEESDIVMACHYANGEFGYELVNICIREQQEARAAVQKFPAEVRKVVARCTHRWQPGWVMVKNCVEEDLAAAAALEVYPQEHEQKIDRCRERFGNRGDARVRACVDEAIEAENKSTAR